MRRALARVRRLVEAGKGSEAYELLIERCDKYYIREVKASGFRTEFIFGDGVYEYVEYYSTKDIESPLIEFRYGGKAIATFSVDFFVK